MRITEGWEHATRAAWAAHGAKHDFRYRHPIIFTGSILAALGLLAAWLTTGIHWHLPGLPGLPKPPAVSLPAPHLAWPTGIWLWLLAAAGALLLWRIVRWLTSA